MRLKWDSETTIKFIQQYKLQECLWNFKSSEYKNKQMREIAYYKIAEAMNLKRFGIPEVKNKIKNLRSTYSQEMKKIEESKNIGTGVDIYESNLKWLKELEPIFMYKDADKRKTYDNMEDDEEEEYVPTELISIVKVEAPDPDEICTNIDIESHQIEETSSPPTKKFKVRDIFRPVTDVHEHVRCESNEDAFEIFGKSVAMQLRKLSEERALLAQSKIQNILTDFGIEDLRERRQSTSTNIST